VGADLSSRSCCLFLFVRYKIEALMGLYLMIWVRMGFSKRILKKHAILVLAFYISSVILRYHVLCFMNYTFNHSRMYTDKNIFLYL